MVENNDNLVQSILDDILDAGYHMMKYEPEYYDFIEDGRLMEVLKNIAEEWALEIKKNS